MPLRIACDLDGTVADMDAALQREARRLFGPEVNLHAIPGDRLESAEDVEVHVSPTAAAAGEDAPDGRTARDGRPLTPGELRRLWDHAMQTENFWASLDEVEPGAVARLATLTTQLGWEVLFLTQRPPSAGDITQVQSQRWLRAHGFEFPSVMVMRGSRGKVADALALDVVIDDRPENCFDVVADSRAKPILIWRLPSDQLPTAVGRVGIETVFSMADALARLEALTLERVNGRGLFGRLRSAFGKTQ